MGKGRVSTTDRNIHSRTQVQKVMSSKQSVHTRYPDRLNPDDRCGRRRTNSLDSEKENQPVDDQKKVAHEVKSSVTLNNVLPNHNMPMNQQTKRITDLQDPSPIANGSLVKLVSVSDVQAVQNDPDYRLKQGTDLLICDDDDVDEEEAKLVNVRRNITQAHTHKHTKAIVCIIVIFI